MAEWQDISTAPKDGTMIEAQNRRSVDWSIFKTFWGVGSPHVIDDGFHPKEAGFVVNNGKPWWLNEDGVKLAPTPTHWRHLMERPE